jgi:hypothetical protein
MIADDEIHKAWVTITQDGQLDARVHDARRDIEGLRTRLRARYNINGDALKLLEEFERVVVSQLERDIVCSGYGPRFSQADYP